MINYTPTPNYYTDYIAHYGIKGMKWGKRKKKTKTPTIYKYKPARSMTEFDSAMYNDPRYKRKTDALKGDWKMKGPYKYDMYGDPRYERHFDTMKNDPRFHYADTNTTWGIFKEKTRKASKMNYYMPGSVAAKDATQKQEKTYNEYSKAKQSPKKKEYKRWESNSNKVDHRNKQDNGRPNSYSGNEGSNLKSGIKAGRKRVGIKTQKKKKK